MVEMPKAFPLVCEPASDHTFTGNRALQIEEPLIFEIGSAETSGVDFEAPEETETRLGGCERAEAIGLPGLSEPEAIRHYVRLSQKNYSIDTGIFPLGSCTMKHNPRLNEKMARLPGFADIHPLQPEKTVQGALALMTELSRWLIELTGMEAVALSPKAGAHGELCGMVAIRAALEARGEADDAAQGARSRIGAWHEPGDRRAAWLHCAGRRGARRTARSARRPCARSSGRTSPR